jgi:hypothetical protein
MITKIGQYLAGLPSFVSYFGEQGRTCDADTSHAKATLDWQTRSAASILETARAMIRLGIVKV